MNIENIIGSVIATVLGAGVIGVVMMAVQLRTLLSVVEGIKKDLEELRDELKELRKRGG